LAPWTAGCNRADEAEDKAVKAIQELGGRCGRDKKAKGKPIVNVNLTDTNLTDAGLKELAGLKQLQSLRLINTVVTDAGLKHLAGLKQLRELNLTFTEVTDAGLKHLAGLKQLQTLNLIKTKGPGMKWFAKITHDVPLAPLPRRFSACWTAWQTRSCGRSLCASWKATPTRKSLPS
jgi:hypothetical protein